MNADALLARLRRLPRFADQLEAAEAEAVAARDAQRAELLKRRAAVLAARDRDVVPLRRAEEKVAREHAAARRAFEEARERHVLAEQAVAARLEVADREAARLEGEARELLGPEVTEVRELLVAAQAELRRKVGSDGRGHDMAAVNARAHELLAAVRELEQAHLLEPRALADKLAAWRVLAVDG